MAARKTSEYDVSDMKTRLSFLHINTEKMIGELEEERQDILEKLETGYKCHMRSELKRLQSFVSYELLSSWCPKKMAAAGFYYTGLKRSVQCFCCGLLFCSTSLRTPPYEDHLKFRPDCEFIQGKDVGNIPKYDVRVQNPAENLTERSEKYKTEDIRLKSFDRWPFYARTEPTLLAAAGFFFTGVKDTVQCFSCGGCLGNWEEGDDPWKEHAKWFPECEFLKIKKSQKEIKHYIQNYDGFIGVVGKHFTTEWQKRTCPLESATIASNIFEDEKVRQDSFKTWPRDAHADPDALAKAGFFYTGELDIVGCFSCGLSIRSFEPGDDAWAEHMKFNSKCKYLTSRTPIEEKHAVLDSERAAPLAQEIEIAVMSGRKEGINFVHGVKGMSLGKQWLEEAKILNEQLTWIYNDIKFRKISSFGESTHVAIDLKTLYGDISIVSKDTRDLPLQQLTLPEALANLSSITLIEGEAGSGKTALLRKIAILWASGCCPLLSRFSLVFYLSLNSTEREQGLADIICKQLAGPSVPLTEVTLKDIIQQLKNRVLFLLDDFSEMDSVPRAIEELMQKNHLNRLCLVIAVRTDRSGRVRQYAKTVLNIREFPLYSTIYIYRNLFSHNISLVEKIFVELAQSKTFQASLKTPLFTVALCAFWVQHPSDNMFSDTAICEAYLHYNMLKFPKEGEWVKAMLSSCGELALRGLFASCFDFTEELLAEAGVSGDEALRLGLLSKFTTQRLLPVYRFFHPSFQEFLAGKRMSELLESDLQVEQEQGFQYLRQIDTLLRALGRFHYVLKYACRSSSKATPKIIDHLFNLFKSKKSFECHSENNAYLQQHPELATIEQMISLSLSSDREIFLSFLISVLLKIAINAAYTSHSIDECAPIIFQFLTGKALSFDLTLQNDIVLRFLIEHPESLPLLDRMTLTITGTKGNAEMDFSQVGDCYANLGVPAVDQDYSAAFQLLEDAIMKVEYENDYSLLHFPDISPFASAPTCNKIPLLIIEAKNTGAVHRNVLSNLVPVFSISDRIEMCLDNSGGFVESIGAVIEQHRESFTKCILCNTELSSAEQELFLSMSMLESLEVTRVKSGQLPVQLFSNLDKYSHLKELSLKMSEDQRVIDKLPNNFMSLCKMERLVIDHVNLVHDSSRLVEFIQHFPNLTVLHLSCTSFPDFEALMTVISLCKKLEEIQLKGFFMTDAQQALFASVLPRCKALRILELSGQCFTDKKTSELFACSLASLVHLEQLSLPEGPAVLEASAAIVRQFQRLSNIQVLSFNNNCLDDSGLLELAMVAKDGHLQKLQKLEIIVNHCITEAGWGRFFQTLDKLPNLNVLNITRLFTHQIKCHATTVTSFVQCVSRLPGLKKIYMHGWLFDEDDLNMFNSMKEKHPQSKCLLLIWQWLLPFSPTILE
ncbi:baculoviral IAP repeat-containing protein 1 [Rhinatrema bivittatum]|uniref:baculoviral IAP repeat-containing protein 1 n=1 Tax=Rhinatrema bivittatum TaxID=194408 RepID=UPI00112BE030|nr:baculoviral IAP repeat-containing protein 1 [Rhinatrema bivittatum]